MSRLTVRLHALLLITCLASPVSWAEENEQKNKAPVCDQSEEELGPNLATQAKQYCDAARTAEKTAKAQATAGSIQAGVTAVCTAACLSAFGTVGLGVADGWCTSASLVSAAYSFAKAKETMEKLMTLVGPGIMFYQAGSISGAFDFENTGARGKASCWTAGMSALSSFMSFDGASNSKKAADRNRKAADELRGTITPMVASASISAMSGSELTGSTAMIPGAKTFGDKKVAAKGRPSKADPCSGGSGFDATLSCALSQPGNTLPPFVSDPQFKEVLEKLSGYSADQLMGLGNPQSIMQAGLAKTLTPEGQNQFASILKGVSADALASEAGSAYVGGGGGKRGGGDSGLPDINSFLDKLAPGEGETQAGTEVGQIDFGPNRMIASRAGDEEDRRVSLFSRVSGRYRLASSRVSSRQMEMELQRQLQAKPR